MGDVAGWGGRCYLAAASEAHALAERQNGWGLNNR